MQKQNNPNLKPSYIRLPLLSGLALVILCFLTFSPPYAQSPDVKEVINGDVDVKQGDQKTRIKASDGSIIEYTKFDIGSDHTVKFNQPSSSASVLNRVVSGDHSRINGSLQANGHVYLINQAGVTIGQNAQINANGFYAAAGQLSNQNFLDEINEFTNLKGTVKNYGDIEAQSAVHLLGDRVKNVGSIVVDHGVITMSSGSDVLLTNADSTDHVMVEIQNNAEGSDDPSVHNKGTLDAGDGTVKLSAGDPSGIAIHHEGTTRADRIKVKGHGDGEVHVSGNLDASSDTEEGGTIHVTGDKLLAYDGNLDVSGPSGGGEILFGGDKHGEGSLATSSYSYIDADVTLSADATDAGNGGKIIVWSDVGTKMYGEITATGGPNGGDGGFVEVSGKSLDTSLSLIDASAPAGNNGTVLLDPETILIKGGNGITGSEFDDDKIHFSEGSGTFEIYEADIEAANNDVVLEATKSIEIDGTTSFDDTGGDATSDLMTTIGNDFILRTKNDSNSGVIDLTGVPEVGTNGGGNFKIQGSTTGNYSSNILLPKVNSSGGHFSVATGNGSITLQNDVNADGQIQLGKADLSLRSDITGSNDIVTGGDVFLTKNGTQTIKSNANGGGSTEELLIETHLSMSGSDGASEYKTIDARDGGKVNFMKSISSSDGSNLKVTSTTNDTEIEGDVLGIGELAIDSDTLKIGPESSTSLTTINANSLNFNLSNNVVDVTLRTDTELTADSYNLSNSIFKPLTDGAQGLKLVGSSDLTIPGDAGTSNKYLSHFRVQNTGDVTIDGNVYASRFNITASKTNSNGNESVLTLNSTISSDNSISNSSKLTADEMDLTDGTINMESGDTLALTPEKAKDSGDNILLGGNATGTDDALQLTATELNSIDNASKVFVGNPSSSSIGKISGSIDISSNNWDFFAGAGDTFKINNTITHDQNLSLVGGQKLVMDAGSGTNAIDLQGTDNEVNLVSNGQSSSVLPDSLGNFIHKSGTINLADSSSRWLVYSETQDGADLGSLSPDFEEFGKEWPTDPDSSGNGVLYSETVDTSSETTNTSDDTEESSFNDAIQQITSSDADEALDSESVESAMDLTPEAKSKMRSQRTSVLENIAEGEHAASVVLDSKASQQAKNTVTNVVLDQMDVDESSTGVSGSVRKNMLQTQKDVAQAEETITNSQEKLEEYQRSGASENKIEQAKNQLREARQKQSKAKQELQNLMETIPTDQLRDQQLHQKLNEDRVEVRESLQNIDLEELRKLHDADHQLNVNIDGIDDPGQASPNQIRSSVVEELKNRIQDQEGTPEFLTVGTKNTLAGKDPIKGISTHTIQAVSISAARISADEETQSYYRDLMKEVTNWKSENTLSFVITRGGSEEDMGYGTVDFYINKETGKYVMKSNITVMEGAVKRTRNTEFQNLVGTDTLREKEGGSYSKIMSGRIQ